MAIAAYIYSLLNDLLRNTPAEILRLPPNSGAQFTFHIPPHDTESVSSSPLSPILGLLTPTPHALSAFLLEKGFIVRPVVPPTVPPGAERVRICLRASMDKKVIDQLMAALREWVESKMNVGVMRAKL